jgi:Protein of unknown function (DUF3667)
MNENRMLCKNCNHQISENFCSNCGQAVNLKRIDKHYMSHEILHLLHFEKGFLFTVKELMTQPGRSIREFIADNRHKHVKPVAYLIVTSLIYTILSHFFHADDINNSKVKLDFGKSSYVGICLHWMQTHVGYSNIIMGIFVAFSVRLIFRKYKYNFFEIMTLLCFVMGQAMLLAAFLVLFIGLLNGEIYKAISVMVGFCYPTWAIGQFFDGTKAVSYIKSFISYSLGVLLYIIALVIVGLATDLIIKIF